MDTNTVIKITLVSFGALVGGYAGYRVGGFIWDSSEETRNYNEQVQEEPENTEENEEEETSEEKPEEENIERKVNYSNMSARMKPSSPKQMAEKIKKEKKRPYIISEQEYIDDEHYDKVPLTYYAGDDTLSGEDEEILQPDVINGSETLSEFGYVKEDPDVIYVRAESTQTDYEVSRVEGKYGVIVGVIDDPEEVEQSKKRNRKLKD